jgi:hypothetical protein
MTDTGMPFELLRVIARQKQRSVADACPGVAFPAGFPESASQETVEHVAFCPVCQKRLQILNSGSVYTDVEPEPDWEKLLKRIRMLAHWKQIKERIQRFTRDISVVFPDIQLAATRQGEESVEECKLIIFEVNLTSLSNLSPCNLAISRLQHDSENRRFIIEISGFYPQLAGAGARLGIARKDSIVNACGNQLTQKDNLLQIEKALVHGFEQQNGPPDTFNRLIEDAVWLDGILESAASETRLVLRCPAHVSSLLFRKDVWSILLISKS